MGKEGIPHTVEEAMMAAERNSMDLYHKELILFLCDKVKNYEQAFRDIKEAESPMDMYDIAKDILNA